MIKFESFGKINGSEIKEFTLAHDKTVVKIINFGAIITKFIYDGVDVALGFDTVEEYERVTNYFGATVGRVCNRIAYGRFCLNGKAYQVTVNDGNNSLHGGKRGFDKKVFDYEIQGEKLVLTCLAEDGEEGYPANLKLKVTYYLDENGLNIEYTAVADADTLCNITNHSFFNLNGHGNGDNLGHELWLDADSFLPINENFVPTGETAEVSGTPFDFREPHKLGERIDEQHEQLKAGGGYDHAFVLNGHGLAKAATLTGDKTGIKLDVVTDQKSIQLYGGNFLDGISGKEGKKYPYRSAVCLETQGYPNAVNCPEYPSVVLKKGETYSAKTIYKLYK